MVAIILSRPTCAWELITMACEFASHATVPAVNYSLSQLTASRRISTVALRLLLYSLVFLNLGWVPPSWSLAQPAGERAVPPPAGRTKKDAPVAISPQLQKLFERLDTLGRDKIVQARFVEIKFTVSPAHTGHRPPPGHSWSQNSWAVSEDVNTISILDVGLIPFSYRKTADTLIPTSWQPTPVRVDSVTAADFEKACRVMIATKDAPSPQGTPNLERLMVAHAAWKRGITKYCEAILANDPVYATGFDKYEQTVLDQLAWLHFIEGVHLLRYADRRDVVRNLKVVSELSPTAECAADARDLVTHLERFIAQPAKAVAAVDESQLSAADQAALYVSQLVELSCPQSGQPGNPEPYVSHDRSSTPPPTWKLRKLGLDAVPALVKAIEDDTPTRTVWHWRDFDQHRYVWRVSDFAWYVLRDIAREPFGSRDASDSLGLMTPEKKQRVLDDIQQWHAAHPDRVPTSRGRDTGMLLLVMACGGLTLGLIVVLLRRRKRTAAATDNAAPLRRPWTTVRLATLLVCLVLFVGLTAYTGSYYFLSRRGMEEMSVGAQGWAYVPYDVLLREMYQGRDTSMKKHLLYERVYRPLSWLDNRVFGNPTPGRN